MQPKAKILLEGLERAHKWAFKNTTSTGATISIGVRKAAIEIASSLRDSGQLEATEEVINWVIEKQKETRCEYPYAS